MTGEQEMQYIKLRDVATTLKHIKNHSHHQKNDDSGKYVVANLYDQCPLSFNGINLNAFKDKCHELPTRQLFALAAAFLSNVVNIWNPNSGEPSSLICLELITIDKAGSKNV